MENTEMKSEEGLFLLSDLKAREVKWIPTGITGFDQITGGGLVRNSLLIYAGRKGVGKSTFWTQVAGSLSLLNEKVLYVSGEEDLSQFAYRATKRLSLQLNDNLLITDKTDIEFIAQIALQHKVDVVIIDSLPMLHHKESGNRVPVTELIEIKKQLNAAIIFIQHETKSNHIAGTGKDQHLVDIVLKADPEWANPSIRRLKIDKNRFAAVTHEMRYTMGEQGIVLVNIVASDPFNDATRPQRAPRSERPLRVRTIRR